MTKTVQKTNKNAILLMHCPDQSGIVAVVTDFININGETLNISRDLFSLFINQKRNAFFLIVE